MRYRILLYRLFFVLLLTSAPPRLAARLKGLQENDPTLWPEPRAGLPSGRPRPAAHPGAAHRAARLQPGGAGALDPGVPRPRPDPGDAGQRAARGDRPPAAARRRPVPLAAATCAAQLLFLNGEPADRLQIDCGTAFKPLEIWTYRRGVGPDGKPLDRQLVLYTPGTGEPFHLWVPSDSKRALYTPQMEYWLQQWEELHGRIGAERFDLQVCKEAKKVDEATGVPGLTGVGLAAREVPPAGTTPPSWRPPGRSPTGRARPRRPRSPTRRRT